jgi:D-sedoheptulose 7-phosphate isomerase
MPLQSDLDSLYPFLRGEPRDRSELDAVLLRSIAQKADDSRVANERFFADQGPLLIKAARALAEVYRHGGRLFAMGNGGSSCDAAHIAVEFLHPVTAGRPALTAVNLAADIAMISAVGNDVGFDHVFLRQLVAQGRAGDALIGISTSGNSANLIAAFQKAREIGIVTIGLAGGDGGRMKSSGLIEYCLVVESASIHRVQECHVTAYHVLWDLVHTLLANMPDPAGGDLGE